MQKDISYSDTLVMKNAKKFKHEKPIKLSYLFPQTVIPSEVDNYNQGEQLPNPIPKH
jgi:hypothetical protein